MQAKLILSKDEIAQIRSCYATHNMRVVHIAERFNLNRRTVYRYLKGLTQPKLRRAPSKYTPNPNRKQRQELTIVQLNQLPELVKTMTQQQIAKQFGVADSTVYNARRKLGIELQFDPRPRVDKHTATCIRQAVGTHAEISRRFGVSEQTVSDIRRGLTWKTLQ